MEEFKVCFVDFPVPCHLLIELSLKNEKITTISVISYLLTYSRDNMGQFYLYSS